MFKMTLPDKNWYTLSEASDDLKCSVDDLIHFGETGIMEICVRADRYQLSFIKLNLEDASSTVYQDREITSDDDWIEIKNNYVVNMRDSNDDWRALDRLFALSARDIARINNHGNTAVEGGFFGHRYVYFSILKAIHQEVQYPRIGKEDLIVTNLEINKLTNSLTETPLERQKRLDNRMKEVIAISGKRGALTKVAKEEGIARQTLTEILKRIYS